MGNDPATGEPMTLNEWLDRLAPRAWAVVAAGICATYSGIHAMAGNPIGCMSLGDYLGSDYRSKAGIPIVNVPGCPIQPDNFMETLLWLLYQAAGLSPMIPLDQEHRPTWLFGMLIRALRAVTNCTANKERKWRHNGPELTSGYNPRWPR
jgi:hydrogenase small subunit